jgi:PIN domain
VIIDTSAIIAILNDEPERRAFNEAIEKSDICLLSTAGFVEASMVMEYSRGYEGLRDFDLWMAAAVFLMPSPKRPDSRCYSKGRISERPIFRRQCRERGAEWVGERARQGNRVGGSAWWRVADKRES